MTRKIPELAPPTPSFRTTPASSDPPPTFTRNISKGWPDLSLCTQQMIGGIANWEVLEEPSISDHQHIEITVDSSVKNCAFTMYKTLHGNRNIFLKNL
ncbi:hypothetical protein AVEN_237694-1 [Araneus ventricosus]|uniref:Endonuclease/exonuclease/phosphatase domain-containing protein n=1 Tax=Araneus ventricosus TaxID=182803 RepID=A0A4Y2EPP0_ARAVE|nr:hypothetical protein AVEN_237694-1 [Araneus ventricosus]